MIKNKKLSFKILELFVMQEYEFRIDEHFITLYYSDIFQKYN